MVSTANCEIMKDGVVPAEFLNSIMEKWEIEPENKMKTSAVGGRIRERSISKYAC